MRVVQTILVAVVVFAMGMPEPAVAQNLVANHSFTGTMTTTLYRQGSPPSPLELDVEAGFSAFSATFLVTPRTYPNPTYPLYYNFLELPLGGTSVSLLAPKPGTASIPGLLIGFARREGDRIALFGFSFASGTDALGRYSSLTVIDLRTVPVDPLPPPLPDPAPTLPAFDGATLQVPSAWGVRKFEGWAVKLTQKFGTLSGGTSAAVPSAWTRGVMQCHGTQGFIYEIPLTLSYQGFVNGSILYAPDGTWPSWEPPGRWKAIAGASGYTKYVYR